MSIRVETRSAPASLAATRRGFTFYVAHASRSIHLWQKKNSARSHALKVLILTSVSTLAEIEAAADALPLDEKKRLLQFLESRVNGDRETKGPSDLGKFAGTLRLPEDPLAWQQRVRGEWE